MGWGGPSSLPNGGKKEKVERLGIARWKEGGGKEQKGENSGPLKTLLLLGIVKKKRGKLPQEKKPVLKKEMRKLRDPGGKRRRTGEKDYFFRLE